MNSVISVAFIFENPLPIYAVGAVLATFCGLVFLARRNFPSLLALISVVLLTLALVVVELLVVTDGEEIESATVAVMGALEVNDMAGVLRHIDLGATQVRSDVMALMPLATVKDTGAGSIKTAVDASLQPPTATSEFQAKVDGVHTRSGMRVFYFDRVHVTWTKIDGRWLLTDYTPMVDGRPISVVESVRGNRPVGR